MVCNRSKFAASFAPGTCPELLTIYHAKGAYTAMPRAMHRHENCVEFLLLTDGYGVHIVGHHRFFTEAGDLLIMNRNALHDEEPSANQHLEIYSCAATGVKFLELPENTILENGQLPLLKTGEHFEMIRHLLQSMYELSKEPTAENVEIANYLLRAFLVTVRGLVRAQGAAQAQDPENQLAQDMHDYIDAHFMEELSLEMLATEFHLSTWYVSHLFKKIYGHAPVQYILRRRIGEAQSQLIDTSRGITDIALSVGFNSSSYFHKVFSKITGMSPREYRRIYKKI